MNWSSLGDWADEMDSRARRQRQIRLKAAAEHFGIDVLDILGDPELEERLMARYEETGLEWPPVEDQNE